MNERAFSRFDKKTVLNERQLKAFDRMYLDIYNYTLDDIHIRLGIAVASIAGLAKQRGLKLRKGGRNDGGH